MSRIYLNDDWKFTADFDNVFLTADNEKLQSVRLPHTCKELPFHYFSENEYQMICGYQKVLSVPKNTALSSKNR